MMVVLGLGPLWIDFSQLGLHCLKFGVMVAFLEVLEDKPIVLTLFHIWVKVLFGQSGDCLHFSLFKLAFAIAEFTLDALVVLDFCVEVLIGLFELMKVKFWIILTELSHSNFLFFPLLLLLPTQL